MSSSIMLALGLMATTAFAGPVVPQLVKRDDRCAASTQGQLFIAEIGFFADHDCTQVLGYDCAYVPNEAIQDGKGEYACEPANVPSNTPYWAQIQTSIYDDTQFLYTMDQSCPPSGPGAVFATLIDNKACVEMNHGGAPVGLTVYPHGGAAVARREAVPGLQKRQTSCSGFRASSQQQSYSHSVQLSNIVDCTNANSDCMISEGMQHTESVTTSYSVSAGGGIEGLFSVETTFGMDYTDSSTTSITESFPVERGQKGYLAAYSGAELFHGTFTGKLH